jgi:hypothetical protein
VTRYHLAQLNVGTVRAPINSAELAGFMAGIEPVNAVADAAPGFVWRLEDGDGPGATALRPRGPDFIVNMSVWESLEALHDYAYKSPHMKVFRDRAKWFVKMDKPHYCLWWIPAGHIPTVAEGRERLEHYQAHGATPYSFWFSQEFPQPADEGVCA